MPRGGRRPGAGRPRKPTAGAAAPAPSKEGAPAALAQPASAPTQPLEYMLGVMNDQAVPADRRDRMAVAAAPYVHGRAGEIGKKEAKNQAARTIGAAKRFGAGRAPRLNS